MIILKSIGLTKNFGSLTALNDLCFKFWEGGILGLMVAAHGAATNIFERGYRYIFATLNTVDQIRSQPEDFLFCWMNWINFPLEILFEPFKKEVAHFPFFVACSDQGDIAGAKKVL